MPAIKYIFRIAGSVGGLGGAGSILMLCIALLYPFRVHAIVSMEDLHLQQPEDGFEGLVELAASGASGNTDKQDVSAGTRLQWHQDQHTSFLIINYNWGELNNTTNTNKGFAHLRHIWQYDDVQAGEVFLQAQKNEFTRLTYRGLAGAGLRFTLAKPDRHRAVIAGTGLFYERELIEKSESENSDVKTASRANLYLILKYHFTRTSRFVSSTYYQPDITNSRDYRAQEHAALETDINKILSFKLGVEAAYDSRPPEDVDRADVVYRTGLIYRF